MHVRHLFQRTRPFRYGGLELVALSFLALAGPMLSGQARSAPQIVAGASFCAVWPWAADRCRALGPPGESEAFETALFLAECALLGLVLGWASVAPLVGFATAVCLLTGAAGLAGARLLVPAAAALATGALSGAALAPELSTVSTLGADAAALALLAGYTLALADLSHRQARRLADQRRRLAGKSAELERINRRMRRYLPPSLRDRVSRAPDEPCRWERRWLTVAFVDLVGFTELSERLEAEPLAGIVDDYLGALVAAAEARGGEVAKVLGDGVLVVFGLRRQMDAGELERAGNVRAALAFCGALPALLADLAGGCRARGEVVALETRAGLASGYCTLGDRGGVDRLDFTLIGPPVNLASRLQHHAAVNGVLMDEASAALAEDTFALAPRGHVPVKGVGPTATFALQDAGACQSG